MNAHPKCDCVHIMFPAVSISLVGRDFVVARESNLTLTFELAVTGLSFGVVPLRVLAVSYEGFEEMRGSFGLDSTLEEIAGSNTLPSVSALPCKLSVLEHCFCFQLVLHATQIWTSTGQSRL